MGTPTNEQRIRKGLQFLSRADGALLRASALLQKLEGINDAPGPDALLKRFSFAVGQKSYTADLTEVQGGYLQGYAHDEQKMANAVSKLLIRMNGKVPKAMTYLEDALAVPAVRGIALALSDGTFEQARVGCCVYNNTQIGGVSQSFCEGGLQGTWSPRPCMGEAIEKE